jgi:hypothetical protein
VNLLFLNSVGFTRTVFCLELSKLNDIKFKKNCRLSHRKDVWGYFYSASPYIPAYTVGDFYIAVIAADDETCRGFYRYYTGTISSLSKV